MARHIIPERRTPLSRPEGRCGRMRGKLQVHAGKLEAGDVTRIPSWPKISRLHPPRPRPLPQSPLPRCMSIPARRISTWWDPAAGASRRWKSSTDKKLSSTSAVRLPSYSGSQRSSRFPARPRVCARSGPTETSPISHPMSFSILSTYARQAAGRSSKRRTPVMGSRQPGKTS